MKIFRKLRKNYLNKKKIGRYLLYAVGEIILVVIGILIALGINNWNNENENRQKETLLIQSFESDIASDTLAINGALVIHNKSLTSHIVLRDHLLRKREFHDSIIKYFGSILSSATPSFNSSTYETAKTIGMDLIQNAELKSKIVRYYERGISYVKVKSNSDPKFQFETMLGPYYRKHIKIELDSSEKITRAFRDYEGLINDNDFILELNMTIRKKLRIIEILESGLENGKYLIQEIETELSKRQIDMG